MKTANNALVLALLALLLVPAAAPAQESKAKADRAQAEKTEAKTAGDTEAEHGYVDFGGRGIWGEEYGRPDLPFTPNVRTSKYNEYRDIRDGFFIRRALVNYDHLRGGDLWVNFQTQRSIYKDGSYLATVGRYNYFRLQFRYDEIPHLYTNTSRTLYTQVRPGVWTIPTVFRNTLQGLAASTLLPSTIQTQIVPSMPFITPAILRRAGMLSASWDVTPSWNLFGSYFREHQSGTRPFGLVFNSSPSAALTGGYGAEVPEPISYFNNLVKAGVDYGKDKWEVQLAYIGSFLQDELHQIVFDNPFRTSDCVAPNGCTSATQGPATGLASLYPSNSAHYLNFAGAVDITKKIRLMASITPGWLRQNVSFLPYSSNSLLAPLAAPLPSTSLDGRKQTLAMNYTLVARPFKNFEIKGAYRHYDYNNDTPVRAFTPIQGDFGAPGMDQNTPFSYNRKTFELTGNYYLGKKSSVKVGYEGDIMDRSHRDAEHSMENSFISALDLVLRKDLSFRLSYRHSDRKPDTYVDDAAIDISGGIPDDSPFSRRFDEAARIRDRADAWLEYSPLDSVTITGFGGTVQDNYNLRGDSNSATPLQSFNPNVSPYYLYGVLKDISYNYGVDFDYTLSPAATFFAEYSHEKYHKRMASRYRTPANGVADGILLPVNCASSPCDSSNNDWGSVARDLVDIWTIGSDFYFGKKIYLTTYYSLSAGKGNVFSAPLGDPTLLTGPNKFLLTGTNAAVDYPETTNRLHEAVFVFKYKLTKNVIPKLEYRFQQFDNRDYQTSAMTPYMGCVSSPPPAAPVPGCTTPILNSGTSPFPVGTPSPFYPYFVVGDSSAPRYLFLGVDQPSYRVHYLAATLEYHF